MYILEAWEIHRQANSLSEKKAGIINIWQALVSKNFLGLGHIPDGNYRDVLIEAARRFWQPSNLAHQLTWPEFVIVIANRNGYTTSRQDFNKSLVILLQSIGTVGGVGRSSGRLDEYFTFDGWKSL